MNNRNGSELLDFKVNNRVRLAALWASVTLCYLYGDYFELYTPGKVEGLYSGEHIMDSPMMLFIASVVMTIPPLMIFLSLVLRPVVAKWSNIVSGMLFTVMMVLIAVGSLAPWYSFYVYWSQSLVKTMHFSARLSVRRERQSFKRLMNLCYIQASFSFKRRIEDEFRNLREAPISDTGMTFSH